jgi:hypothetical protein
MTAQEFIKLSKEHGKEMREEPFDTSKVTLEIRQGRPRGDEHRGRS